MCTFGKKDIVTSFVNAHLSYLNEIVDTIESVGNNTLAKGKPGRVLNVRSCSNRCYTEGPLQPQF